MALTLLDGTGANIDLMTAVAGTPTTANKSLKCHAGQVRFTFRKNVLRRSTFCNQSWTTPIPGEKTMFAVVSAFMSIGDPLSDPLVLFTAAPAAPAGPELTFVFTAETGSTINGKWIETEDDDTLAAAALGGRQLSFESSGPVTTTWVVA
jgi:hypothetical protein